MSGDRKRCEFTREIIQEYYWTQDLGLIERAKADRGKYSIEIAFGGWGCTEISEINSALLNMPMVERLEFICSFFWRLCFDPQGVAELLGPRSYLTKRTLSLGIREDEMQLALGVAPTRGEGIMLLIDCNDPGSLDLLDWFRDMAANYIAGTRPGTPEAVVYKIPLTFERIKQKCS